MNQALLFRYFGNKEALFAQVVAAQALEVLHAGPPEELLERTQRSILSRGGPGSGPVVRGPSSRTSRGPRRHCWTGPRALVDTGRSGAPGPARRAATRSARRTRSTWTRLVATRDDDRLSEEELLLSLGVGILIAGHETTMNHLAELLLAWG